MPSLFSIHISLPGLLDRLSPCGHGWCGTPAPTVGCHPVHRAVARAAPPGPSARPGWDGFAWRAIIGSSILGSENKFPKRRKGSLLSVDLPHYFPFSYFFHSIFTIFLKNSSSRGNRNVLNCTMESNQYLESSGLLSLLLVLAASLYTVKPPVPR